MNKKAFSEKDLLKIIILIGMLAMGYIIIKALLSSA